MADETKLFVERDDSRRSNNNNNNVGKDNDKHGPLTVLDDEMLDFETKMFQFLDPPRYDDDDDDDDEDDAAGGRNDADKLAKRQLVTSAAVTGGATPNKWFCNECDRSFAAQFALDQHRRFKHQGYKIHCRYCTHTTTNGYAMFLHVRREHGDVDEEAAAAARLAAAANAASLLSSRNGGRAAAGGGGSNPSALLTAPRSTNRKAVNARRKRRMAKVQQVQHTAHVSRSRPCPAATLAPLVVPPTALQTLSPKEQILVNGLSTVLPDTPYNRRKRNAAAIKLGSVPALQCDRCDKKFAFQSGLRMHMKMVHSGFKFTCQYCGMSFTNGYAIHRHVNIAHNVPGSIRQANSQPIQPQPMDAEEAQSAAVAPTTSSRGNRSSASNEHRTVLRSVRENLLSRCNTFVGKQTAPPRAGESGASSSSSAAAARPPLTTTTNDSTADCLDDHGDPRRSRLLRRKAPPSKKPTPPSTATVNGGGGGDDDYVEWLPNDDDDGRLPPDDERFRRRQHTDAAAMAAAAAARSDGDLGALPVFQERTSRGGGKEASPTSSLSHIMRRFGECNGLPSAQTDCPMPAPSCRSSSSGSPLAASAPRAPSASSSTCAASATTPPLNNNVVLSGGYNDDDDHDDEDDYDEEVNICGAAARGSAALAKCSRIAAAQGTTAAVAAASSSSSLTAAAAAHAPAVLACPLCPYKTRGRETMRQHFYYHLPTQTQPEERRNGLMMNDYALRCPFCSYSCDQQSQLATHAASHFVTSNSTASAIRRSGVQSQTHKPQLQSPTQFACVYCSRRFADSRTLAEHEARHTKTT